MGIKFSNRRDLISDEKILKIIQKELNQRDINHYELKSIVSLNKPNITSVIINTRFQEIALEIDNDSKTIQNIERIAR